MTEKPVQQLIRDYRHELVEDHHSPGSLRFSILVIFAVDISHVLPYLNAVLEDTRYDHVNGILIGSKAGKRYAFRPHEIRLGLAEELSQASAVAGGAVELVNETWNRREEIAPSLRERKVPAVYDIFKSLPKNNCRKCGCSTCLVFADQLRNGKAKLDLCPVVSPETRQRILSLFRTELGDA